MILGRADWAKVKMILASVREPIAGLTHHRKFTESE
jgi:hypothetical protein